MNRTTRPRLDPGQGGAIDRQSTPDLAVVCGDLAAEQDSLDSIVGAIGVSEWDRETPAVGWSIRDQIGHLALGEDLAVMAAQDPGAFYAELGRAAADAAGYLEASLRRGRAMDPGDLLGWWRTARERTIEAVQVLEPHTRIPWVGPAMKPLSFLTARLMETFAHGQDVRDALGMETVPTSRLRHVAHLGVITRGFSYTNRGRPAPESPVRVELSGPDGEKFAWGPEEARDRVVGAVLDFCLIVTQRINVADTGLEVTGPAAQEWLTIAQAFAGPPTDGRPPRRHR